jgi:hypothetical protein
MGVRPAQVLMMKLTVAKALVMSTLVGAGISFAMVAVWV